MFQRLDIQTPPICPVFHADFLNDILAEAHAVKLRSVNIGKLDVDCINHQLRCFEKLPAAAMPIAEPRTIDAVFEVEAFADRKPQIRLIAETVLTATVIRQKPVEKLVECQVCRINPDGLSVLRPEHANRFCSNEGICVVQDLTMSRLMPS